MQLCSDPVCGHSNRPSARFCEKCGLVLRLNHWAPLRSGHMMRDGAYRILEPLGKGGMGALYLAADTGAFDRKCVVKELLDYYDPADPAEVAKAQSRFETEARLLSELSHPGIPRIYSYFSEGGHHFIVMEYIEGETLERAVSHRDALGRVVAASPLPAEEVVRHAVRICRVLEYLTERATPVIHHDIKPANLIVDKTSGEVRLVDFGTAHSSTRWSTRAQLGRGVTSLFGTQGYAAPEQHQGRSEPCSDVYALAATVYHLLTDDDPGDHSFHFPKMDELPGELADALGRALRPEAKRRSDATEFRQSLEAWLIPDAGVRPFVFRNGAVAHTTEDLVTACDQHWSAARQHLADGDFDQWFKARNRHDLVAKGRSARLESNADAALELFLRRLNPRLQPPRLVIEPETIDFGILAHGSSARRHLRVRNETRGYGQATFSASAPWLQIRPVQVGCLVGEEERVTVLVDTDALPLRREHPAIITCSPERGQRKSIPVMARLNLAWELLRRLRIGLRGFGRMAGRGARKGLSLWARTFRSTIRSRYGPWVLVVECLIMAAVMVALWWTWRGLVVNPVKLFVAYIQALPVALLAVYLAPALALVAGAVVWEGIETLRRSR